MYIVDLADVGQGHALPVQGLTRLFQQRDFLRAASPLMATHGSSKDSATAAL
jgi:hypothetical protein